MAKTIQVGGQSDSTIDRTLAWLIVSIEFDGTFYKNPEPSGEKIQEKAPRTSKIHLKTKQNKQ